MFDFTVLKKLLEINKNTVMCPVLGCSRSVPLMKDDARRSLDSFLEGSGSDDTTFDRYFCSDHGIYITPTTFAYRDLTDNLLRPSEEGRALEGVMSVKRENAPLHYEDSEEAFTWNVFRFLERAGLVDNFVSSVANVPLRSRPVVYWSYSREESGLFSELGKTRVLFGERAFHGSEPDLIIVTDNALFMIEAKLAPGYNRSGGGFGLTKQAGTQKGYVLGCGIWFSKVFASDYKAFVSDEEFDLMRLWLLGSWMARSMRLDFFLVNLAPSEVQINLEMDFGKHIHQAGVGHFVLATWESIYSLIMEQGDCDGDSALMLEYLRNKTIGYRHGELTKALTLF